ncbi:hypothetical protein ABMA28_014795 [Loxostege sticticalis]|uniref:FAM234A/B beta-propeller domain-containing protein n=1 Tax=Loxostege sticticalis TaxID=481309 RepID=A0ABD0TDH5_LOXSC
MSANGNGGNYAPLKQILSDSESEDDKLDNAAHIKATDSCNNLDFNSGLQSSKNYSLSDMDEFNTNMNTVESTMDNVSFLQSDVSTKMSFPRRCAFITSIVACLLTVVIFLWGIPCSEVGSCAAEWHDKTTSWELPYDEIELSGAVQVVEGAIPNTKNLIFIYRGNHMKDEKASYQHDNVNGVLLIVGNSGKVGWYTRDNRIPTEINCHLIDVNRDNQKDCIVSGSEGLLAALNPLSGTYYWNIHKHGQVLNIAAIDFPILMKDMDKDKVNDLLTVATVLPNTNHNSLLIISGATGNIIGEPMSINDCLSVKLLTESDTITYICKNGTTEAVRVISYPNLYRKLLKLDKSTNYTASTASVTKRVNLSLKKNIGNTREIFTNGPGKLIVENSGECPNSCRVNLKLILERNGTTNASWEYAAGHVYAMRPSSFAFANSIRGFVLKL